MVAVGGQLEAGAGPRGGGELGSLSCQGGQGHTVAATEEQAAVTSGGTPNSILLHGPGRRELLTSLGPGSKAQHALSTVGTRAVWVSDPAF